MANPVPAARVAPANVDLKRGYQSLVTFAADTDINLWEKTVSAPPLDTGDEIDTTTMHNSEWETRAPRALKILDVWTFTAGWDPCVYSEIEAILGLEEGVTVHFPDLTTLAMWGFLKRFEPAALERGVHPECTVTVVPTNWDPTNKVEAEFALNCVTGT